jgi:hypothetical protein
MPAMPDNSTAKFSAGPDNPDATSGTEKEDTEAGTDYSAPDSQNEPAIMLSQAQADAAGMTGAMPGDSFTVKISVTDQNDDGFNVELEPGSAVKNPGPSEAPQMSSSMKPTSPADLGMSPTIGNT